MTDGAENSRFFCHESSIIDVGAEIGAGVKVWHFSHISTGAKVGENTTIGQGCFIGKNVRIGSNVKLQNQVSVFEGVTLSDGVFCGPSVVFTNVINPRSFIERKNEFKKTLVEEGVSIGANATIVCGVTLGKFCLIGAGSVVASVVPKFALVVGVPARQIGWVSREGIKLSVKMGEEGEFVCPQSKTRYSIADGVCEEILA